MRHWSWLLGALIICLAACGQKGPLVLPQGEAPVDVSAKPEGAKDTHPTKARVNAQIN